MVGIEFLEWLVTLSDDELNATLDEAVATERQGIFEPRRLMKDMVVDGNPTLSRAFEALPINARLIASGAIDSNFEFDEGVEAGSSNQ